MQINVLYKPAHTIGQVWLQPNEQIMAESGAMVGMSTNVQMQTQSGGVMSGLKRMFSGESFFRNTFTAANGPGEVLFAPPLCGDMAALEMSPQGYFLASTAFIACSPHVNIETKVGGVRSFFSGAGLFIMKATTQAPGQLIVGGFGAIQEIQCDNDLVIDTGHLVAWDATLEYSVTKSAGGWVSSFLSGEGLVCSFRGQGRIWIQSRNASEYGQVIGQLLPPVQR